MGVPGGPSLSDNLCLATEPPLPAAEVVVGELFSATEINSTTRHKQPRNVTKEALQFVASKIKFDITYKT